MKFTSSRAVSGVTTGLTVALIILASSLAFLAYTTSNEAPVKPISPVLSPMTQIQGQLVLNGNTSYGVLNFYNTGNVALAAGTGNVAFTTASGSCFSVNSPAVSAGSSASVQFSCTGVILDAPVTVTATLSYTNNVTTTNTVSVINTHGLLIPVFSSKISMQGQFIMLNFNGTAYGVLNFYNTGNAVLPASQTPNVVFAPQSGSCASIQSPAVAPQSSAPAEFSCTNVLPGAIINVTATFTFTNSVTTNATIAIEAL